MNQRELLIQIRDNTLAELAKLATAKAKVDYSIDGQSVQHGEAEERLWKRLEEVEQKLASLDAGTMVVTRIR